jgi:hypothetical protein
MDQAEFRKMKSLFEPKQTVEELDRFIREWLNISLPWDVVDEDSTSSALKAVWGVYKVMLTNKGPTRHVIAASRNAAKTVDASLIQFLSLLHMRRDGAHIAAIIDQSLTAIRYLDSYMSIPGLAQYRKTDNVRIKRFVNLPPNDLTPRHEAILRVVTATKKGANSPRASCLTLDEVDLTPQEILSEVAFVADPERHNKFSPVFVYLSSRKTNDGPIQKLMDQAESTNNKGRTKLHKWSHADFMEKCLPEIHKPEFGPQMAFLHTESLDVIWGEQNFKSMPPSSQNQYKPISAWEGCKTCPAFVACQGRSVKQRGDSSMLRTREFVGDILENVGDPAVIIAQSLNWKPESTGIVFKTFSTRKHMSDPVDFYEWATGSNFNPDNLSEDELSHLIHEGGTAAQIRAITPTKIDIFQGMKAAGWTMIAGVDFGYNPDPAVIVVGGWHPKLKKAAIIHTYWALDHANHVWASWIAENIYPSMPVDWVAPDMADKSSPTYFQKYNIPVYSKSKLHIDVGVSFIRGLLWNPVTQQSSFMILDDSADYGTQIIGKEQGNLYTANCMSKWTHHKSPTTGWDMSKFADNQYTHPLDAMRYMLAPFIAESKSSYSFAQSPDASDIVDKMKTGNPEEINTAKKLFDDKNQLVRQVSDYYSENFSVSIANPADKKVDSTNGINRGRTKIRF